jgi:hypothetical protein
MPSAFRCPYQEGSSLNAGNIGLRDNETGEALKRLKELERQAA